MLKNVIFPPQEDVLEEVLLENLSRDLLKRPY